MRDPLQPLEDNPHMVCDDFLGELTAAFHQVAPRTSDFFCPNALAAALLIAALTQRVEVLKEGILVANNIHSALYRNPETSAGIQSGGHAPVLVPETTSLVF